MPEIRDTSKPRHPLGASSTPRSQRSWSQSLHRHPSFRAKHPHRPPHREPTYRSHSKWFTSLGRNLLAIDTAIVSPLTSKLHPDTTEDNTQERHHGMREGPRNGRAQNSSSQVAAAWSFFLALKQEAVGAKKQQGSSANLPKPEPARAQNPCAKPSPVPSSPDGLHSLLMPPSPPLQEACYARTHPRTTTSMVSCHPHATWARCLQPNHSPLLKSLAWIWPPPVTWRLISKTVLSLPGDCVVHSAEKRCEGQKKKGESGQAHLFWQTPLRQLAEVSIFLGNQWPRAGNTGCDWLANTNGEKWCDLIPPKN